MALADLMTKGFLTSATATSAPLATHGIKNHSTVATVAGVAVAKAQNSKSGSNAETLLQFRFDLVQQEIDAGYPLDELKRANNITWRLITAHGFQFHEAMMAAAQWVVDNPPHHDEAAFVDVMALFKGMSNDHS